MFIDMILRSHSGQILHPIYYPEKSTEKNLFGQDTRYKSESSRVFPWKNAFFFVFTSDDYLRADVTYNIGRQMHIHS